MPETASDITVRYEQWIRSRLPCVFESHLEHKHEQMARGAKSQARGNARTLPFLRATFYLWTIRFRELCPQLTGADVPAIVGIGDVHLQNFGTWRDVEGRLVWGINDLDEVAVMPYTNDLVRLAASALLGDLDVRDPCSAVFDGYLSHVASAASPRPFVLAEHHAHLKADLGQPGSTRKWWRDYQQGLRPLPVKHRQRLTAPLAALADSFIGDPPPNLRYRTRRAGLGSLGRPRVIAIGHWRGSLACREAKAMLPSAWGWNDGPEPGTSLRAQLLDSAARATDPHARVRDDWLIRAVGPDHRSTAIQRLGTAAQYRMLRTMGAEVANLHRVGAQATGTCPEAVLEHLKAALANRPGGLAKAAHIMAAAVRTDQREYAKSRKTKR